MQFDAYSIHTGASQSQTNPSKVKSTLPNRCAASSRKYTILVLSWKIGGPGTFRLLETSRALVRLAQYRANLCQHAVQLHGSRWVEAEQPVPSLRTVSATQSGFRVLGFKVTSTKSQRSPSNGFYQKRRWWSNICTKEACSAHRCTTCMTLERGNANTLSQQFRE